MTGTLSRMAAAKRSSRRSRSSRRDKPPWGKHWSKCVVRRGGIESAYLQKDGAWGGWKTAKSFDSQTAARKFYRLFHSGENYGLFPRSAAGPMRP